MSVIQDTLLAVSDELARIDDRCDDLIEESDPRTATETLDEWEEMLGLPDEAVPVLPATDAERQLVITQKYTSRGGQSRAFLIELAAKCGYVVTITEYSGSVSRSGTAMAGYPLVGEAFAFFFLVTVTPPAGTALTHAQLEAVIRRAKPAHTYASFEYL